MMTDQEALRDHVKFQTRIIKIYEQKVKNLDRLIRDQAELIDWLSDKHEGFYKSEAWLELRLRALETYGHKCMSCGGQPPEFVIQVDHIKPKSIYPHLALVFENLQVLCEGCNRAKSNKLIKDFREQAALTIAKGRQE